jgi:hypothetical protein
MFNDRVKFLAVFFLLLAFSCKNPFAPEPKANLVIDGALQRTYASYGCPRFEGYVKNIGDNTAYNCMVTITCYSDTLKTTIIDTAKGFPADLGDIAPGQRAYFSAAAFNCISHEQIKAYDTKIEWLDR